MLHDAKCNALEHLCWAGGNDSPNMGKKQRGACPRVYRLTSSYSYVQLSNYRK